MILVIAKCEKCGKEYELESNKKSSDFQCECGGELSSKDAVIEPLKAPQNKKCVLCGKELESNYEYCPECGGSTKELKIRTLPIPQLVAFNVIGGLILFIAMGIIAILIVLIINLIIWYWYRSPKI